MTSKESEIIMSLYFLTQNANKSKVSISPNERGFITKMRNLFANSPNINLSDSSAEAVFGLFFKFRKSFPFAKTRTGNHIYYRKISENKLKKLLTRA